MAVMVEGSGCNHPYLRMMMLIAILLGACGLPARAQVQCGGTPSQVPVSTQEQLKGDVEGKAQILAKFLPGAQIKGAVEISKNELYQEHRNVDKYQIDMYFM
jgi:hypothetical protein